MVGTYLEWMYTQTIEVSPLTNDKMSYNDFKAEFEHLARAYVFGEKVQDDAFCNSVTDAMLDRAGGSEHGSCWWYPTTKAVSIIYDGTPEGSPARRLCVHLHTHYGKSYDIQSTANGEHPEFLKDLTRSLLDEREDSDYDIKEEERDTWHKNV